MMAAILEDIVFQHAEDACALWHRRSLAAAEPHYSLADLIELDSRVSANIKGLLVAGPDATPLIGELVAAEDDGAVFTAALVAIESGDHNLFNTLLENLGATEPGSDLMHQLSSALAWVQPGLLAGVVKKLLNEKKAVHTILGLLACAAHGKASESIVQPHIQSDDSALRTAATRVAANSGLTGLLPALRAVVDKREPCEQYEFARALALLGDKSQAMSLLTPLVFTDGDIAQNALKLYLQTAGLGECKAMLKKLDNTPGRERDVVSGFGAVGDPVAVPWLIGKMADPLLNRLAGESISMITGVDVVEQQLELENVPEEADDFGPNDDPEDDNVALDEDEDLPWCDPNTVSSWWARNARFTAGHRYIAGSLRTTDGLNVVLKHGLQRQRKIAAINLAVVQPQLAYVDTVLPAKRQVEALR